MANGELVEELFKLHNKIRKDPKFFIPYLKRQLENYDDLNYTRVDAEGNEEVLETSEGKQAVLEAIKFLTNAPSLEPLTLNKALCRAAESHAKDIGQNGLFESIGTDGRYPEDRIRDFLDCSDKIGETLDFNSFNARDIIYSILVDDGVADRSRRNNLFSKAFKYIGIGIAEHVDYGICTILDYVEDINDSADAGKINVFLYRPFVISGLYVSFINVILEIKKNLSNNYL